MSTARNRAGTGGWSQPLRILVVHPGAELYGSDRMLLESVHALTEDGHRVVVVVPGPGPLVSALEHLGAVVRICPMPVLRRAILRPSGMVGLLADTIRWLPGALRLLALRPDLIYISTLTLPFWLLAARLAGRATVCHVHEAEQGSRVAGLLLGAPLMVAHRVIVNSQFTATVLAESVPTVAARAAVIGNGVAGPDVVTPPRPDLEDGLRVLFVGRLSPRKGPQVALAAIRRLRERGLPVQLRLLGDVFDGYEWFAEELHRDYGDLVRDGSVEFLGFRPSVWPHLDWADVAVVPSTQNESFGNAAVEAVLAARPVLVSRIGGLPEAVAGVPSAAAVPVGDPDALADALARVAADWTSLRHTAWQQAEVAAARFAPAHYRSRIAQELSAAGVLSG